MKLKHPRTKAEFLRQIENAAAAGYLACMADRNNGLAVPRRVASNVRRKIRAELARWLNS
jgi:hypothetical protein